MKMPDRVSVSVLSQYYWCPEKTRLVLQNKLKRVETAAMRRGTICHTMLEKRPLNKNEETLRSFLPHPRPKLVTPFRGVSLVGIPDDLLVDNENQVTIVEFKTKSNRKKTNPKGRQSAVFQLQTYCWMMNKYLKGSEFTLGDEHFLRYVTTTLDVFEEHKVEKDLKGVESTMNEMFTTFEEDKFIQPEFWKCSYCEDDAKSQCRYWQAKTRHEEQSKEKRVAKQEEKRQRWMKEQIVE
jgi:CRISPR/Cas system-associated exonuclease Cas4 (RecB family)